ncbi:MAG: hypothetical protein LH465_04500 [Sphingomonas bacterium]|nr:hypothetical protein [Sphingomonas bacterium]
MDDRPVWFAPKRFGLGSGLPVSWQGWLVSATYIAVIVGASIAFGHRPILLVATVVPASILFLIVSARTTRGGWRWRWRDE